MAMYPRRKLYPDDWPEIASAIKEAANWTCQQCSQACYRPGERVRDWRRVLTVAHLDRDPAHNDGANLKALCVVCHLNYDRAVNVRAARRTRFLKRAGPMLPLPWAVQE
jgi:hypothetical protein